MVGSLRFAVAAILSLGLYACESAPPDTPRYTSGPAVDHTRSASIETADQPVQCVPYARNHSGVNLFGDAGSWWDRAAGHYPRSSEPSLGSVLVLTGYAGPHRGHLAVVIAMDSPRQIRVDHANWFNDGRIYRDDPVVDVSPDNDWSEVRVWNARDNVLGARTYLVQGFIGPAPGEDARIASRE